MIFSSLSSFAIANANQTLNSYVVDGTITTTGCKIIGGIIFNQTTLMMPIQICHHINHNFQISELPPHSGCIAVVRYWKDPDSGNVYAFGNPCIAPQFLDPSKGNLTDIRPIQSNSPLDSPLKQFKSGIAITDVKCSANYVLIIKAQDGSPVCVKPDTAQKLIERGWAVLIGSDNTFTTNVCGNFYTIQVHRHTTVPVLLMSPNSTSCAKLTYAVNYHYYDKKESRTIWPRIESFPLRIGDLHYEKHDDEFGVTSGNNYTDSFKITTIPEKIDLANYPVGSNFTVTYIIRPLSNATGFYDESIPMPPCIRYPLAVGYTADKVNSSDFSKGLDTMLNHSCFNGPQIIKAVEIAGMSYTEMALP